ncbi:hypothetical protein A0H81_05078 [Grifola frondosa]|uniref:Uncharacterized protein n=1 Tax=Grifola frondosa TaxID=5627 RepID=A0A1C7MCG6_GRIFR|nr:hypothetical protein A0H81_05078 [Grifola frondosa]
MSPRSTRSSRSIPKWSSFSTPKKQQPPTSVSLVFAQPEHGAPLRSAIANLPAIDDAESLMSETSTKRERVHSTSSSAVEDGLAESRKRSKVDLVAAPENAEMEAIGSNEGVRIASKESTPPLDIPKITIETTEVVPHAVPFPALDVPFLE